MSTYTLAWAWKKIAGAEFTGKHPAGKLVLLALADYADNDGVCWPGVGTVARRCGIDTRQVQRYLADFEEVGLLSRTFRGGESGEGRQRSTLYTLAVKAEDSVGNGAVMGGETVTHALAGTVTPEEWKLSPPSIEPSEEEPSVGEEGATPPPPASLEGWKERMREAKHQGDRVAVLVDLVHSQTGIKRNGGKAAALLKKVGDPEVAVERTWASLKADGDPFRYAMAIGMHAKTEHGALNANGGGQSAAEYRKAHPAKV